MGKVTARNVRPLRNQVLVRIEQRAPQIGGIILPDVSLEKKEATGFVVALGDGDRTKKGIRLPIPLDVGHRVILPRLIGTNVEIDGHLHALVDYNTLLAVYL